MDMLSPESYTMSIALFLRLLGVIYFFAFGAFLFQIKGLLGENGILPINLFLDSIKNYYPKKRFFLVPTLFWIHSSDRALMILIIAGTAISILLTLGIVPWLMLLLLYVLYLSIISIGQEFLSFGWEGFLLEVTANAFLASLTPVPNLFVWISLNFLLFRFHFQSGIVKLQSHDPNWRNLTAVAYHYNTQPLPVALAWTMYKLPLSFQKFSCLVMFIIELIVPFGMFGSEYVRLGVFFAFFFLQYNIWISGNYSFLNHLTAVFSLILISNTFFLNIVNKPSEVIYSSPLWLEIVLSIAGGFFLILQLIRFWDSFFPSRWGYKLLLPFSYVHLANRYGIFAIMTSKRYEIIIEGSQDGISWQEYGFWYKPSEVSRRPRRISPYQPRIDWQAWFLPFSDYESQRWFKSFLFHLLKGTPEVLALLRHNPFPHQPPKYIKSVVYDYEWSSAKEKKENGNWWRRTFIGNYSPVLMLRAKT
jgi:hypothetical protein